MTDSGEAWPVDQTLVTTPSEGRQASVRRDVASCDSRDVGSRKSWPLILACKNRSSCGQITALTQRRQVRAERTDPTPTTRPIISTPPPTPARAAPATVVPAATTPSTPSDSSTSRKTSSWDFGRRWRRRAGMRD